MKRTTYASLLLAAAATALGARSAAAGVSSIFATGFEPAPAFPPYFEGELQGQNGWEVYPRTGSAVVTADVPAPEGIHCVMLTDVDQFARITMPHIGIPEATLVTTSYSMMIPPEWSEAGEESLLFAQGMLHFNPDGDDLVLSWGIVLPQQKYQDIATGAPAFFIELRSGDLLVAGAYKEIPYDCIWNAWRTYEISMDAVEQSAVLRVDGIDEIKLGWRPAFSLLNLTSVSLENTRLGVKNDAPLYFDALNLAAGEPPCYADCDESGLLNVADFSCFLNRFAAGDPWANCDGSIAVPVLNVADFTCYIQQFAAGCPVK